MGEEEKKPEAKAEKPEDVKEDPPKAEPAAATDAGEKKDAAEAAPPPPPPPPEEVVLHVYMHCEGCARKVRRSLKGFEGVEDVKTDCKTHKVVVKGRKAAEDPLKVVERVQKKSGRKVELLSPIPPPKPEPKPEEKKKEEEPPKVEEKKEEPPVVITVVLKVHMHCEACALAMKKRILKMKGIEEAEPELKSSQVTVKGVFEPAKLVEYIYKKSGKHAVVVKQEPAAKPEESAEKEKGKEEAKADTKPEAEGEKKAEGGDEKEKKDEGSPEEAAAAAVAAAIADGKPELRRNEFVYYYPRIVEYNAYTPQIFSDENPNACSVM